jgi:hypothetical protein
MAETESRTCRGSTEIIRSNGRRDANVQRDEPALKGTDMKDTAEILAFKGKELKTVQDLQAAQLALFHDIASGAVTPVESRLVQEDLSARLWEFEAGLKAAKAEVLSNHCQSSALASGALAGNKDP